MNPSLIQIHPDDNVVVLGRAVEVGERLSVGGRAVVMSKTLTLGHKLALRDIVPGEKILKYGVPIGSASAPIRAGEHVHVHNLKSDYLPTYTLDDDGRKFKH